MKFSNWLETKGKNPDVLTYGRGRETVRQYGYRNYPGANVLIDNWMERMQTRNGNDCFETDTDAWMDRLDDYMANYV